MRVDVAKAKVVCLEEAVALKLLLKVQVDAAAL